MCGRYVLDRDTPDLVALFDVDVTGAMIPEPSWNIAPTALISVVIDSLPRATEDEPFPEPVRRIEAARWGLVPGSAKDPKAGPPLFNARSEDVAAKPSFAAAVERRRAVIPASGYYEWSVVDGEKVAQYISLPGEELLLFAGLYEWWRNPAVAENSPERWLLSATILTRAATGELATIHERMPVFLEADLVEEWLDPQADGSQDLVDAVVEGAVEGAVEVAGRVTFHAVGPAVGSVENDSPDLIRPI
jgi:putative SOS response-associated peptidase YedK